MTTETGREVSAQPTEITMNVDISDGVPGIGSERLADLNGEPVRQSTKKSSSMAGIQ